jgi:hypothetical protein
MFTFQAEIGKRSWALILGISIWVKRVVHGYKLCMASVWNYGSPMLCIRPVSHQAPFTLPWNILVASLHVSLREINVIDIDWLIVFLWMNGRLNGDRHNLTFDWFFKIFTCEIIILCLFFYFTWTLQFCISSLVFFILIDNAWQ